MNEFSKKERLKKIDRTRAVMAERDRRILSPANMGRVALDSEQLNPTDLKLASELGAVVLKPDFEPIDYATGKPIDPTDPLQINRAA